MSENINNNKQILNVHYSLNSTHPFYKHNNSRRQFGREAGHLIAKVGRVCSWYDSMPDHKRFSFVVCTLLPRKAIILPLKTF